jgi:hypothetical protein
MQIWSTNSRWW